MTRRAGKRVPLFPDLSLPQALAFCFMWLELWFLAVLILTRRR